MEKKLAPNKGVVAAKFQFAAAIADDTRIRGGEEVFG
jgi:hypothetical protein